MGRTFCDCYSEAGDLAMKFRPLELAGAFSIEMTPVMDDRGFFARSFCSAEFAEAGLPSFFPQSNISFNRHAGTVRGMHFQLPPHEEPKVIRCTAGVIYDAIIDLRPQSPTYRQWVGIELSAENRIALYVPPGFAHGFQTLADNTEVLYLMGDVYAPDLARGVRWNDPAFDLKWPNLITVISDRDAAYPDFVP